MDNSQKIQFTDTIKEHVCMVEYRQSNHAELSSMSFFEDGFKANTDILEKQF